MAKTAKQAVAGGPVKTQVHKVTSSHGTKGDSANVGHGPMASVISPVGKRVGYAMHGKKEGTIDQKGNK